MFCNEFVISNMLTVFSRRNRFELIIGIDISLVFLSPAGRFSDNRPTVFVISVLGMGLLRQLGQDVVRFHGFHEGSIGFLAAFFAGFLVAMKNLLENGENEKRFSD